MKRLSFFRIFATTSFFFASALSTFAATDFSGTWVMSVAKSKNLGMMASMQITLKIEQSQNELKVIETAKYNGQDQVRELHYDLTGKTAPNSGPMGDPNQTITKWVGATLETSWSQEGAVAGTKSTSQETRWLSEGGKIMSDQYSRTNKEPMVIVFDKQ